MNLTGHWKGTYTYGQEYPPEFAGKSAIFEFDITDKDGILSGTCIDEVVKSKEGNESYIIGTFRQKEISFKKRYKYHLGMDESGELVPEDNMKADGVDYKGRLRKKLFSRKLYFSGEWSITMEFKDENKGIQTFVAKGTWKMSKMD